MPRRSERRKNLKDTPGGGGGSGTNGSNGSSGNKGNGKGKGGSSESGSPGVRSLRPRPGKPKVPNGNKAGRDKASRNGGKKGKSPKKDSTSYVSPSGEEYRPGGESGGRCSCIGARCGHGVFVCCSELVVDFAYVDSQRPDLPYHICKILHFKSVRGHSVTVCVWRGGLWH